MDEQTIDQIERYLRGEMEGTELEAFETRLEQEEALSLEVEQNKQGNLIMESFFEQQMMDAMMKKGQRLLAEEKYKEEATEVKETVIRQLPKKEKSGSTMVWLGIAASVLLIISIAGLQLGWFSNNPGVSDPSQVIASYYSLDEVSSTGLLSPDNPQTDLEQQFDAGIKAFDNKDYNTAIQIFQTVRADSTFEQSPRANFLLGVALLESGQYPQAIQTFDAIPQAARSYYLEGQWFKANTLWKSGNQNAARTLWQQIANDNSHPKVLEARALLSRL